MLTERIREILQQKKRGYSEVPSSVIDVVAEMNDQYYIGRKFQLKRQKDGTVTLTDRKNNVTLELKEGGDVPYRHERGQGRTCQV